MCMKLIKLLIVIILLVLTLPHHGKTAAAFVKNCQAEQDTKAYGYCLGFVTAHISTVILYEIQHDIQSYCMEGSTTIEKLIALYIEYYEDHEEIRDLPEVSLIEMAMRERFPCD